MAAIAAVKTMLSRHPSHAPARNGPGCGYRRGVRPRGDISGGGDRRGADAPPKPKYLQERARRRAESRLRVEQVALDLFTERGFAAVTVEQVCEKAGIAVATFYRYFGSKEEVFFGYEPLFLAQVATCAESVEPHCPPATQVQQFVQAFCEFLETQRDSLTQRDDLVQQVPALRARTLAVQRDWEARLTTELATRRGHRQPEDDDHLDASVCLAVLRGGLRVWRENPTEPLADAASGVLHRLRDRLT
jgi:AcrR family transcriptional regulator